jgi:hypothetical protein
MLPEAWIERLDPCNQTVAREFKWKDGSMPLGDGVKWTHKSSTSFATKPFKVSDFIDAEWVDNDTRFSAGVNFEHGKASSVVFAAEPVNPIEECDSDEECGSDEEPTAQAMCRASRNWSWAGSIRH